VLLVLGWFLSGGEAPDYTAADGDWTAWADDNRARSGIGAFLEDSVFGYGFFPASWRS
jgi:hypothetical protein